MENVGAHRVKAAEIHINDLLAPEIVKIIEAEANFYVNILKNLEIIWIDKLKWLITVVIL